MDIDIDELLKQPRDCFINSDHPASQDPEHWCVGPVILTREHLSFKVLKKGPGKKTTKVYGVIKDWFDGLSDYPVADDELLSRLEYEAGLAAIESEGSRYLKDGADEAWVELVIRWLSDHCARELEDHDGNGPYPSTEAVREAMRAVGVHEEEEEEEEE